MRSRTSSLLWSAKEDSIIETGPVPHLMGQKDKVLTRGKMTGRYEVKCRDGQERNRELFRALGVAKRFGEKLPDLLRISCGV